MFDCFLRYEVMKLCWQREPEKRPEFEELAAVLGDLQAKYELPYETTISVFIVNYMQDIYQDRALLTLKKVTILQNLITNCEHFNT